MRYLAIVAMLVVVACSPSRGDTRQVNERRLKEATVPAVEVVAVGDIACHRPPNDPSLPKCGYDRVADLVRSLDPDRFLALGDLQETRGSADQFRRYYDPYFGDLKPITAPVPGNHELYTRNGKGYYTYFGEASHRPGGWYSFDLGDWHLLALNSQACRGSVWNPRLGRDTPITPDPTVGAGCAPGSRMYEFAKADLTLHADASCTLVYMHHPPYGGTSSRSGPTTSQLQPLWELLYEHGVDVVLTGHVHNYQRFQPMDGRGHPDANGLRLFIVGTGGTSHGEIPAHDALAEREVAQNHSYGVLRMTLRTGGYGYEFITAPGEEPFEDAGSGACV